ncbi:SMAD6 interacting protein AMSH, contains JAB/MPN/Mov34 domain [Handroanthus impetiginosus]|uniref:SMAD6 interacting protein AMSH, contains JAB/MPN/Mov34 domain n=1 Tax=Handroanthus impetiginosus TaxID=429701 RepID=A0A2G9HNY7_9LAMI|nr:SMAD6 interacting protein AMSH, contains JAB/MPN/Mov34 domain [Handroanthus impetiginosus]
MRRPAYSSPSINFSAVTRKIEVDNRISLRNYYRIADNLLKQANIYREEKNLIDLYVILLRYSSLVSETIPYHQDYQTLCPKERTFYKKKLPSVLDELETLKPQVRRQLDEQEKVNTATQVRQFDGPNKFASSVNNKASLSYSNKQMLQPSTAPSSSLKQNNEFNRFSSSNSIDSQFQKLSLSLPLPKQETLSRHSFLGPNGLRGQWLAPSAEIKVSYPTNIVMDTSEFSSLNQVGQQEPMAIQDCETKVEKSSMESVLSLDDGRWLAEESGLPQGNEIENNAFQLSNIRQPSPPPVLAQVQPELLPISPSRVADPRPGPPKLSPDALSSSNSYQDLHIPVRILEDFLRVARENTTKNLETCGVLAGSLRNRVFHITTLIIPKQESTSDSCQTLNEEEIFDVQDKRSLFPLGWIHTHPTQTCFMSSVDLHTHYSYQVMLPEAIAIVMAPTDTSSPHGIFHLSDPGGVSVIRNCQQRGFHPHEEPEGGSPIYEHCSHVYMNSNLKFDVVDLR